MYTRLNPPCHPHNHVRSRGPIFDVHMVMQRISLAPIDSTHLLHEHQPQKIVNSWAHKPETMRMLCTPQPGSDKKANKTQGRQGQLGTQQHHLSCRYHHVNKAEQHLPLCISDC
jgi:hypothetical protein